MALLSTSRGLYAIVDDEQVEALSAFRWRAKPAQKTQSGWYVFRTTPSGLVYLHRQILDAPKGTEVDHINGDGLDNRKSNLRLATRSQNNANTRFPVASTGFRGVHSDRTRRKYRPSIQVNGRAIIGPRCDLAIEAAIVRDRLAHEHFGEFAILNFPCLFGGAR